MSPATAAHEAIQAEAARLIGNQLAAGAAGCRVPDFAIT
jgi:hypothetical protein